MRRKRLPCVLSLVVLALTTGCSAPTVKQAPVAAQTPVIFMSNQNDGPAGLMALHANSGLPMWKLHIGALNSAPVMVGGTLYASPVPPPHTQASIVAVRASDGKVLWRIPVQGDGPSLLAADDSTVVALTSEDELIGFVRATGKQRWYLPSTPESQQKFLVMRNGLAFTDLTFPEGSRRPSGVRLSPTPVPGPTATPPNGAVPGSGPSYLVAVRASDGAKLWQTIDFLQVQALAINDRALYSAAGDNVAAIDSRTGQWLAFSPPDTSGSTRWQAPVEGWLLAASDQVVLISNILPNAPALFAVSAVDGHLLWEDQLAIALGPYSRQAIIISGNVIYAVEDQNTITAIHADDGKIAWRAHFDHYRVDSISIVQRVIVAQLGAMGQSLPCVSECVTSIVALDAATGAAYWQRDEPGAQMLVNPSGS